MTTKYGGKLGRMPQKGHSRNDGTLKGHYSEAQEVDETRNSTHNRKPNKEKNHGKDLLSLGRRVCMLVVGSV